MAIRMIDDTREIADIFDGEAFWRVGGSSGITKIEVYEENGEMAAVPWFALWAGDAIKCRINAARITGISYKETT